MSDLEKTLNRPRVCWILSIQPTWLGMPQDPPGRAGEGCLNYSALSAAGTSQIER